MPVPVSPVTWWGSLLWLIGIGTVAFLVAWATGTRLRIRRSAYIPILLVTTVGLSVGYVAWLGLGASELIFNHWGWGLLAAGILGVILGLAMTKQPATRKLQRRQLPGVLLWEGVVYGTAEGVLLSALPAFVTWQMVHSLGWKGIGGALARWTLPVVAAALVILVHHLGYWNCRNRILIPITLGCSLLTVGFLVTASVLAAAVGHILMHFAADVHGVEMPPVERPQAEEGPPAAELAKAA